MAIGPIAGGGQYDNVDSATAARRPRSAEAVVPAERVAEDPSAWADVTPRGGVGATPPAGAGTLPPTAPLEATDPATSVPAAETAPPAVAGQTIGGILDIRM